jgi:hypothetical protein
MSTTTTEYMLSTIDNPYNPFNNYPAWSTFDINARHGTSELLGRISFSSYELSELDERLEINAAIDEILREDVTGLYIKVTKDYVPNPVTL